MLSELCSWWISLVFPSGQYLETESLGDKNLISVRQVVEAAVGGNRSPSNPLPSAIGLDCTKVVVFHGLLTCVQEVMDEIWEKGIKRPWRGMG